MPAQRVQMGFNGAVGHGAKARSIGRARFSRPSAAPSAWRGAAFLLPRFAVAAGGHRRAADGHAQSGAAFDQLAHPRRLLGDEFLQRHFAALHHVQRLLPDRRGTRVGDRPRHGVDQAERRRCRRQRLALANQIAAVEQALNDPGAGRLGADAGGVLSFCFSRGSSTSLATFFIALIRSPSVKGFGGWVCWSLSVISPTA